MSPGKKKARFVRVFRRQYVDVRWGQRRRRRAEYAVRDDGVVLFRRTVYLQAPGDDRARWHVNEYSGRRPYPDTAAAIADLREKLLGRGFVEVRGRDPVPRQDDDSW